LDNNDRRPGKIEGIRVKTVWIPSKTQKKSPEERMMSGQVLRRSYKKRYKKSPFDALLEDPYDEDAWYQIFGENLRKRICTVAIRERTYIRIKGSEHHESYWREALAFW